MELRVVRTDDQISHLQLIGVCDANGVAAIETRFTGLLAAGRTNAIVELNAVSFLSSLGIRLLLATGKALAREGKKLVLVAPRPEVEDILHRAALDKILPIAATAEAALELIAQA